MLGDGAVSQNQGEAVWGQVKKEPVSLLKVPREMPYSGGNQVYSKGKRVSSFCGGAGRDMGVGVPRGI